ncbi:hypothetical protein Dimus_001568, partial [Dionaea muscipula]
MTGHGSAARGADDFRPRRRSARARSSPPHADHSSAQAEPPHEPSSPPRTTGPRGSPSSTTETVTHLAEQPLRVYDIRSPSPELPRSSYISIDGGSRNPHL